MAANVVYDDTTVQAVLDQLVSGIFTTIPEDDLTAIGAKRTFTAAVNTIFGDPIFINADGKADLCNATAVATCPYCLAIATGTIDADEEGTYLIEGTIRNDAWAWEVGKLIYVSTTGTNGTTLTQTKPTAQGSVTMAVGIPLTETTVMFFKNVIPIVHI